MAKATKTDAEKAAEAKAKEAAAAKAEREKKKAEEKAEKEKAREEARAAKAAEKEEARQGLIDEGKLVVDGDYEYHLVEKDDTGTVEDRASQVIERLKASTKSGVPVSGRELADEFGGGWPQYLSFFSMLKVQGLVKEYRRRGGESSGVCYLWVA